jgi:hypothetical protein
MTKQSVRQRAHEQMHQLPGVPEHSAAENLNHRGGLPNRPLQKRQLQNQGRRIHQNHGEPKVLVGWQNAIGRFFSRRDK